MVPGTEYSSAENTAEVAVGGWVVNDVRLSSGCILMTERSCCGAVVSISMISADFRLSILGNLLAYCQVGVWILDML